MQQIRLGYPPTDREELWWVTQALFGVKIPRTRVCPDHCSPFDAFADAYFRENTVDCSGQTLEVREPNRMSRAIWHASRGLAGKSKSLSTLGLTESYLIGTDITILGGSLAQSNNVHEYMVKAMEFPALPLEMVLDQTATKIQLANKGRVRPLPASQRNVRGPHPSMLLMDEVDEMDLPIYDAALGQPLPQDNYLLRRIPTMTVISSTWQNPDGTLTEIFRRNEEKAKPSPIYRWCYKENLDLNNPLDEVTHLPEGWLTQETVDEKVDEVSAEMFRVEYDLGEPAIGNRAFTTDLVDKVFCWNVEPEVLDESKDYSRYRFERRVRNGVYVVGADWAKENDFTVVYVVRMMAGGKRRLVYYIRVNRRPWPQMIGWFNTLLKDYRVAINGAWHDSTGLGDVVDDYVDMRARPFTMTGDKRAIMLNNYVNAIEKGIWEFPVALKRPGVQSRPYTEMKYCRVGDLYRTSQTEEKYHLPDTVCAGALAEHAARRMAGIVDIPQLESKDESGAIQSQFANAGEPEQGLVSTMDAPSMPIGEDREISFLV